MSTTPCERCNALEHRLDAMQTLAQLRRTQLDVLVAAVRDFECANAHLQALTLREACEHGESVGESCFECRRDALIDESALSDHDQYRRDHK